MHTLTATVVRAVVPYNAIQYSTYRLFHVRVAVPCTVSFAVCVLWPPPVQWLPVLLNAVTRDGEPSASARAGHGRKHYYGPKLWVSVVSGWALCGRHIGSKTQKRKPSRPYTHACAARKAAARSASSRASVHASCIALALHDLHNTHTVQMLQIIMTHGHNTRHVRPKPQTHQTHMPQSTTTPNK